MHIQSIRIRNYRSFEDTRTLAFAAGFNLIVGANNVGKSSLLHCLAAKFSGEPHRSIHVLPARDEPLNKISQVDFVVAASGFEVRRLLINNFNGERFFPWPDDVGFQPQLSNDVLARILTAPEIPFRVSAQSTAGSQGITQWLMPEYPATYLYPPRTEGNNHQMLRFEVATSLGTIDKLSPAQNVGPGSDVGISMGPVIIGKIYQFHAERMTLGVGPYGTNNELAPNAQNLPEVLNILQGNPGRFEDYCNFVQQIFPSIQKISVRPHPGGGNQIEIMVWQVDPKFQRDDLAIPLTKCGSGVGQVLAILYVAKISEQPRTIIIDEPGSFLHPGAARALMSILKGFGRHQYIIATHSPEIIAELSDAPVTIVRWADTKSSVEQAPRTTRAVSTAALGEIGARLSDVFGFDKVLWVEGQSDADTFKSLLEAVRRPQRRIGILPVRDTGSFQRRKISEIIDIYRRLSMGDALLPPAVAFLFDREGRSEKDIEDAKRESAGKIWFLRRRMLENYLLEPSAIARLFNEVAGEHEIPPIAEEAVRVWIVENGRKFLAKSAVDVPLTESWYDQVDGARILAELFQDLSSARLNFRKATHTPRLAVLLHQMNLQAAQKIVDLVANVVE